MYGYQSVRIPGILAFHSSSARIKLLSGPNRGSKSTRGAWELVTFATGYNPIRRQFYPTPNICWAVSLDNKNYGHIIEERLREWLPAGTKWAEGKRYFQLPAPWKSRIYLKSAEPGETKFAAEVFWPLGSTKAVRPWRSPSRKPSPVSSRAGPFMSS